MADSNITVDGLTAEGGIGQVVLIWNTPIDPHTPGGLPYLQKKVIEIWAGPSNDRGAVTTLMIGEQPDANSFTHAGLSRGQIYYYWIRARNRSGKIGEWYPLSATGGIVGMESNSDVLLETNGFFRNKNSLIEQWGVKPLDLGNTQGVIDFPLPFPNQCFNVVGSPQSSQQFAVFRHPSDSIFPGKTGFSFIVGGGESFCWRAVGY